MLFDVQRGIECGGLIMWSNTGYSALMDFVLAFLPWKLVWSLQMRKKEKFGVAVAMSLGVA